MEIKHKFEMTIETRRRFIIRQSASGGKNVCWKCGEAMLTAEQTANFFGIKQRNLFRIVETGAAHFVETETGAAMICIASLADFLDGQLKNYGEQ